MDNQPTLVLGATGTTGRRVAQQLQDASHAVRAASRGGQVPFDWSDPATWEPAVTGTAAMYLMASDGVSVEPSFVQLAVDQGVRRIVLLSSMSIEAMGDARLLAAERTVRDSRWTGPSCGRAGFTRTSTRGSSARRCWPVSSRCRWATSARCSWTPRTSPLSRWPPSPATATPGRTYALTGPRALSFAQAVEIVGQASGRSVRFRGTDADYLAQQNALGAPEEQTRQEIDAFAALRALGDAQPTEVVRRVTGRAPKDVATLPPRRRPAAPGAADPGTLAGR
jgi:uncharacterized protein YbjT (DUF2867 family)